MHAAVAAAIVLLHATVMGAGGSAPARHLTVQIVRSDGHVTRVRTDAAGRFHLRLRTGPYTVRIAHAHLLPGGFLLVGPVDLLFVIRR